MWPGSRHLAGHIPSSHTFMDEVKNRLALFFAFFANSYTLIAKNASTVYAI